MSFPDNILYKAYLDCLFLDREDLQSLTQQTQSYESAVMAANSLLEHIRTHPKLSSLELPKGENIKGKELPLLLDYLHRALWRLLQKGKKDEFLQTLQQELAYLIPRLWNAPRAQQNEVKRIKERLITNAELYKNTDLIHSIQQLENLNAGKLLRVVDDSLSSSWPKQLGIIVAKSPSLLASIQANNQVDGIDWQVFTSLSETLQRQLYQEPNVIIITLDQPRIILDRLLTSFPRTEVIGVVEEMSALKSQMVPGRVQHILEEKWLSRFLPGMIKQNLVQKWKDTRSLSQDFLTELPSLMGMREQHQHLQGLFSRVKGPMTLAVIELPVLKHIEAQEGPYLTGEWLKSFSHFIKDCLRSTDLVGRWAPDKFVCLMPQTHLEGALIAFERCLEKLPNELALPPTAQGGVPEHILYGGMANIGRDTPFEKALLNAYTQLKKSYETPDSPFSYDQEELKSSLKPHILLLDDDPIIQEMLRFVFSREGYEVTQLTSGKHVIETLNTHPTSLVLLDIMMPGMDGFEVLETIRSQRNFDNLPVVILSSMKGENDLEKGFSLGADDYIYKPFSPSELVIRIRRFLR